MRADLHTHSLYSDGSLTSEKIAELAARGGVELIALTDHDTSLGCNLLASAAKDRGIKSVFGVEISAYDGDVKFHTLGYGMDADKFAPFERKLYDGSFARAEDIIKKLGALNMPLTLEEVASQRFSQSSPVHGIHIALAMKKRGYISGVGEYFREFSAAKKPAFSCAERPTPEETVEAVISAGGLAVTAHPGRIDMDEDALSARLKKLKDAGLGGIEVYYTTHTNEQTAYYKKLCDKLSLLKTGGSDTHREGCGRVIGAPPFYADDELLEKLKIV